MRSLVAGSFVVLAAACARVPAADGVGGPDTGNSSNVTDASSAPTATKVVGSEPSCRPADAQHSWQLTTWAPPDGCTWTDSGETPFRLLADDKSLAAALHCSGANATFDFAAHELVVGAHAPGSNDVPLVALGGDTATSVTVLQQSYTDHCPGDPVPAPPYAVHYAFVAPHGAMLVASRASCTMKKSCP